MLKVQADNAIQMKLVGFVHGVSGAGKADARIGGVVFGVASLKEGETVCNNMSFVFRSGSERDKLMKSRP